MYRYVNIGFDLNRAIERTLMAFAFGVGVSLCSFAVGYNYAFREVVIKNNKLGGC